MKRAGLLFVLAALPAAAETTTTHRFVRVHEYVPPHQLAITAPDPAIPPYAGTVEISQAGHSIQTISLEVSVPPETFRTDLLLADFDFDGHRDLGIPVSFGAKWTGYRHLVYDPESSRFVSTALTRKLDELGGLREEYDAEARTVTVRYLRPEGPSWKRYRIEADGLVEIESVDSEGSREGIVTTRRQRVDGQMVVVEESLEEWSEPSDTPSP